MICVPQDAGGVVDRIGCRVLAVYKTVSLEDQRQDGSAMSVVRTRALANEAAVAHGTDPAESLVSISEESPAAGLGVAHP